MRCPVPKSGGLRVLVMLAVVWAVVLPWGLARGEGGDGIEEGGTVDGGLSPRSAPAPALSLTPALEVGMAPGYVAPMDNLFPAWQLPAAPNGAGVTEQGEPDYGEDGHLDWGSEDWFDDPVTIGFPGITVNVDEGVARFLDGGAEGGDLVSDLNGVLPVIVGFYHRVTPVFAADLKSRLLAAPLFEERVDLAGHHLAEGVRLYKMMRLDEAVSQLNKAEELLETLHGQWTAVGQLVEVHLYTALASLEAGDRAAAHLAFKRLLALRPDHRLQEGWFSVAARSAFDLALNDFQATYLDRVEPGKASELATGADVDFLLFAHIKRRAGAGIALELALFDRKSGRYLSEEVVPLLHNGVSLELHDVDLLDRALSKLITCIPNPDQFAEDRARKQAPKKLWSVDGGSSFLMFIHGFTRNRLPNYGATVSSTMRFPHSSLALWSSLSIMVSDKDHPREDIREDMYLGRLMVGGGMVFEPQTWLELGLFPALEVTLPSKTSFTWDPQCKYDPSSSPDCAAKIQSHNPGLLFGGYIRGRAGFRLTRNAWMYLNSGIGRYFASVGDNKLDLPLDFSLSFGYRY